MSVLSYILSVMSPDTCRYYMCKVPPCNHSTQYYIRRTSLLHSFVRYKYETSVTHSSDINSTDTILPCHSNHSTQAAQDLLPKAGKTIKIHKQVLFKKTFPDLIWSWILLRMWKGSRFVHVDLCILGQHAARNRRDSHRAVGCLLPGRFLQRREHALLFGLVIFWTICAPVWFSIFYILSITSFSFFPQPVSIRSGF